jgi:hypothetical protein
MEITIQTAIVLKHEWSWSESLSIPQPGTNNRPIKDAASVFGFRAEILSGNNSSCVGISSSDEASIATVFQVQHLVVDSNVQPPPAGKNAEDNVNT